MFMYAIMSIIRVDGCVFFNDFELLVDEYVDLKRE